MAGKKYGVNTDESDQAVRDAFDEINKQRQQRDALAVAEIVDDPLGYVINVILKEAKQEDRLVRQLLYVMLSAKTNNPFNLAINAPTGEGKNWVIEKVAAVFEEEDVIKLHGMTDKALLHDIGELVIKAIDIDFQAFSLQLDVNEKDRYGYYKLEYVEKQIAEQAKDKVEREGGPDSDGGQTILSDVDMDMKHIHKFVKKLINLEHKILIFLDTPRMSLFEALMPLLSHDSYESEYKYVDTSGPIKTYKNLLRGWPCFVFAQAIDYSKYDRFPELQRRFIITNPTMDSTKKYEEAIHLTFQKNCLPDFMYQKLVVSDREKRNARDIISYISKKIKEVCSDLEPGKNDTLVPFAEAAESGMVKKQTSDMTSARRFSSFLKLLPIINITKRPSIVARGYSNLDVTSAEENHVIPLAIFDDLNEAFFLMRYSNGVRPYILQWYYDVFLECYNGETSPKSKTKKVGKETVEIRESRISVTTTQLIEMTKQKKGKSYTSKYILEHFVYPLMNQGYIDTQKSEINGNLNIYWPAHDDKNDDSSSTKHNPFCVPFFQKEELEMHGFKINVEDLTTFPNKQYITSQIRWVIESSSEMGLDTHILDYDGKEVPLDQLEGLVDKYYPNPEKYFEHFTRPGSGSGSGSGSENNNTQHASTEELFENRPNEVVSQESNENDVNLTNPEERDENQVPYFEKEEHELENEHEKKESEPIYSSLTAAECDLRNQEGADRFRAAVEAERLKNKTEEGE